MLSAALAVLERDGLNGFSLRAIGDELGVAAPAISYHVGSRDALLVDVVDYLLEKIPVPPTSDLPCGDWLRLFATSLHTGIMRHGRLAPVILDLMPLSPRMLMFAAAIIEVLDTAGLRQPELLHFYNAYVGFVLGYTGLQANQTSITLLREPDPGILSRLSTAAEQIGSPHLRALFIDTTPPKGAARPGEAIPDTSFTLGLEALLRGYGIDKLSPRRRRGQSNR